MYVKAFIVNVNKRPKPFFLEQHISIVNKAFGLSLGEQPRLRQVYIHLISLTKAAIKDNGQTRTELFLSEGQ